MLPVELVQSFASRWQHDHVNAMTLVSPSVVYRLNVAHDTLPIGGEMVGAESIYAQMMSVRAIFDYLVYKPRILSVDGETVRVLVEFVLRHRVSRELLFINMRSVYHVKDDLIVVIDEFVDAPMVEAFMRFAELLGPPHKAA